ncbi:hypothetical protein HOC01_01620 [archaeon]|nr:hypothetical protein [archaeon]MBT6697982.1 hypothetical protein [archaeon]
MNKKKILVVVTLVLLFLLVMFTVIQKNPIDLGDDSRGIIPISNAKYLDSSKDFVLNVFDYVKEQDDNWSEKIYDSEYVQVTFEQELDNSKDITVYARGNGSIEVYEHNKDEIIATFPEIVEEGLYKIYLTEFNGTQDTYDLKVVGEYLEFDYIVDPTVLSINFSSSTPKSGDMFVMDTHLPINVSFNGDNVTIYLYNSSSVLINSSNSTVSPYFFNFTDLSAGVYYFNATTANTTTSNSTETRNILVSANGIGNGVNSNVKISDGLAGFYPFELGGTNYFGSSITTIGDLDGDGVQDLAVGARNDANNASESSEGAVYILFMNVNGSVSSNVKITDGMAGFSPSGLGNTDHFGSSITNIGDLDGDGVQDLAVGASDDENSDSAEGAVYILFMNVNGSVASNVKITDGMAGFNPSGLDASDMFGTSIANIGDLDGDGVKDLAVGAYQDSTDETNEGAVYILFMNVNGSVSSNVKITDGMAGFYPIGLAGYDRFGTSIANIGDLDGDGVQDLAVGAYNDENSDSGEGAVYILFMDVNGSVSSNVKISDGLAGFYPDGLDASDWFGYSVANIGDLDGDGVQDLVVSAKSDENLESAEGAFYILFMNSNGSVDSNVKISDGLAGFNPDGLSSSERSGDAIANIGDLDGDGVQDLAFSSMTDENLVSSEGAIYVLFMGPFSDTIAPSISFAATSTSTGNYSQTSITTNITATDDNLDTVTVYLYNSTGIVNTTTTNDSISLTYSNLPDGTYFTNATANDTSDNNASTETRTIILDTILPYFTGIPTNVTIEYVIESLDADFNATDTVRLGTYFIDDTANFTINNSGSLTNNTLLALGTYTVNVSVNDSSGNVNSSIYGVTVQDTTNPTWGNNKTNLTTVTTSGSNVYFNLTFDDASPANYTFGWYNGTDWTNDSVASYTDGEEIEVTKTVNLARGTYNWTWYFNDTEGNSNQSNIWSITLIDTVSPYFTGIPTNASLSYGDSLNVEFNATDETEFGTYSIDDTTNFTINGSGTLINSTSLNASTNYTINVSINDSSGNMNNTIYGVVIGSDTDTTAPTFTNIANQSVEYGFALAHDINATDAIGVSCFSVNDTTNFQINCSGYLENNTALSVGLYDLNITVNDTSGNNNSVLMWVNITPDITAPTFTVIANQSIEYESALTYDIDATDINGISCFSVNDTTNFQINCSGYLENNTVLSVGLYDLNITVNDTSGNNNSALMWVNITDTTVPIFTVIANQSIEYGSALTYDIDATDASGISCFSVNDTTSFQINCSGYLENNTALSIGLYDINITVNDTTGTNNSALMWVNVSDTTNPTIN